MAASLFDQFLGNQETPLPEGGGTFKNTGFVGRVGAKRYWKFWSAEDLDLYEPPYRLGEHYVRRGTSGSYFYYFNEQADGKAAAEMLQAYAPNQTWVFEVDTSTVLNFTSDDALERFGQSISADCRIVTPNSAKYRHEYHLLALPGIVQALASAAGFVSDRLWHMDEVLAGMPEEEFTEAFQHRMIGDADAKTTDSELFAQIMQAVGNDANVAYAVALGTAEVVPESVRHLKGEVKIHYTDSVLWRRRAALWAALGEPNPAAYLPAGTAQTENGKAFEATSERLSQCLGVSTRAWTNRIWARFHLAPDPRVDATYSSRSGSTRRLSLPLVTEIFADEAAARAAAEADKAASNPAVVETKPVVETKLSTAGAAAPAGEPPVPETWGEAARADWRDFLAGEKAKANGVLPAVPVLAKMAGQMSCSVDDIRAWWELV